MNMEAELQFYKEKNNNLKQEISELNQKIQQQRSEVSLVINQK